MIPSPRRTVRGAALLLASICAASCNPKANAVHARATSDLACPSNEIEVRSLGGSAYQASGCGETVTYVCQREQPREAYEKDTGLDQLFFAGDHEGVACMREGDVKPAPGSEPPRAAPQPAAGAGRGACPAGSHWEGGRCVGDVAVTCPPGHRFEVNVGCVPGAAPTGPAGAAAAAAPARSCPAQMVLVPGGTVPESEGQAFTVPDLCVDRTEVTAAAYGRCVSRGACSADGLTCGGAAVTFAGNDRRDHPINCVSWGQAAVYCKAEGKRLPTDDEWIWMARGGGAGTPYPWGDAAPADRPCWSGASKRDATCAAGTPAGDTNPQRVLGLAGNVAEWTTTARSGTATRRVVRGGSYASAGGAAAELLAAVEMDALTRAPGIGFRCVAAAQ